MQSTDQPKTDQPPPPFSTASAARPSTGEAQSTGTAAATTETPTSSPRQPGVSVGEKLKGAVHVIHGAGEELRGSILTAFDTMRGKDTSQTEASQIAGKGREERHGGINVFKPGRYGESEAQGGQTIPPSQSGQTTAPSQRDAAAPAVGTGLGKDILLAEEGKQAPPSQREEASQGKYQASGGVQDDQSPPGYVAASQAAGQGVGQQMKGTMGGPPGAQQSY